MSVPQQKNLLAWQAVQMSKWAREGEGYRDPPASDLLALSRARLSLFPPLLMPATQAPGGGVLPYMGYIGMCGPKGYGFSAV